LYHEYALVITQNCYFSSLLPITWFLVFAPPPRPQAGQGLWNWQFSFPFNHRCYKPNLVKIGSVFPDKTLKMFKSLRTMYDGRRLTKTDSHRSPKWLRWPKNANMEWGHLKILSIIEPEELWFKQKLKFWHNANISLFKSSFLWVGRGHNRESHIYAPDPTSCIPRGPCLPPFSDLYLLQGIDDCYVCYFIYMYVTVFNILKKSFPWPAGQFQPNLVQIILRWRELKIVHIKGQVLF
jgi:hypothetical protein